MKERKSTFWPSVIIVFIYILAEGEGRQCGGRRGMVKMVMDAYCLNPVEAMVPLPVPQGYDSVYPSVVKTKRCTGKMCPSHTSKCVAKEHINRTISIEGHRDDGAHCVTVKYQEATRCECACAMELEHCGPNEIYNKAMCKCMCDPHQERKCKKSNVYMWESKTCTCKCTRKEECDVGSVWVTDECKCMPLLKVWGSSKPQPEEEEPVYPSVNEV